MAYFAQLDENNIVTEVVAVANETIGFLAFPESEPVGIAFLQSLYGENTIWKQTSYNSNFRVHYAGVGMEYYPDLDAFGTVEAPPVPEEEQELNQDLIGVTRI
jgi:hypothetical protein